MTYYKKTVVPVIESHYENLSSVERNIADFFISNQQEIDFSAKNIAGMLYVSEASLSRFAQKCGYKGYREFVYNYKDSFREGEQHITGQMRSVFDEYQELLNKSYNLVEENQLFRIVEKMAEKNRVFVYGKGSSGLAAKEMQFRFMRLGLLVEAMDDGHMMLMNSTLLNKNSMVIGFSISGKTSEVMTSLREAHKNGAYTVLLTANEHSQYHSFCDEVVCVAARKNLDLGNLISPQYPLLMLIDILYGHYQAIDSKNKKAYHEHTVAAITRGRECE